MQTVATFDPLGGEVNNFIDRTQEFSDFGAIASFAEDAAGELYVINLGGPISKVVGFLRGDFDRNGVVDEDDLTQWVGDYGVNGSSDADADGDSAGTDFLIWQQQFASAAPFAAATQVPEPTGMALALAAGFSLAGIMSWGRPECRKYRKILDGFIIHA